MTNPILIIELWNFVLEDTISYPCFKIRVVLKKYLKEKLNFNKI